LNNDSSCACPPGADTCECDDDESEGTEQEPDESSIPEGESQVAQPTEPTQPTPAPAARPQPTPAAAITTERQRIAAILTCEEATGREELARTLALETNHRLETAKRILTAAPKAAPAAANPLQAAMSHVPNPAVGAGDPVASDSPAAEVQRILSFVPRDRVRAHARVQ